MKRFHIVTHSYVALFSIKTSFNAKKTEKETKPMRDSESTSKIKVRSHWAFFKTLLMSAVICILKVFHGN